MTQPDPDAEVNIRYLRWGNNVYLRLDDVCDWVGTPAPGVSAEERAHRATAALNLAAAFSLELPAEAEQPIE